jgi:predicted secreted Zn-dependent protease
LPRLVSDPRRRFPWLIVSGVIGLGCLGVLTLAGVGTVVQLLVRATATPPAPPSPSLPPFETAQGGPSVEEPDAGSLPPEIAVEVRSEDYALVGASADELRRELTRLGPKVDGGRFHAYTGWHVTWSYPYQHRAGACATGPVTVTLRITATMPRWDPPPEAPPDLVARWHRYRKALEHHENGHLEHGRGAARDVLLRLSHLDAEADCVAMNRVANAAAQRIVAEYRDKDRAFDLATRHGATQGATFP